MIFMFGYWTMRTTLLAVLLPAACLVTTTSAFVVAQPSRNSRSTPLLLRDFGDPSHEPLDPQLAQQLQARLSKLALQTDTLLTHKWTQGDWTVRGLTFDDQPIVALASDHDEVWVGLANGTVTSVDPQPETIHLEAPPQYIACTADHLWTVSNDVCLQQWFQGIAVQQQSLSGGRCVALGVTSTLVFTVTEQGSVGLWDEATGDKVWECSVLRNDDTVLCASIDEQSIALGTQDGTIHVFRLEALLERAAEDTCLTQPKPHSTWPLSSPVTAIALGGPGVLGRRSSSQQPTQVLWTGTAQGLVQQWEVLPTGQHWPQLPTQKLPQRAHLLKGHTTPVRQLAVLDHNKVVSVAESLRAWSPQTGDELFAMDGFEDNVQLCWLDQQLVTSGMGKILAIHEFDGAPTIKEGEENDYLDSL